MPKFKYKRQFCMLLTVLMCSVAVFTAGCGKSSSAYTKESSVQKDDAQAEDVQESSTQDDAAEDEQGGTQTLMPISDENFYIGTWKALFYYDAKEDKMVSMEEDEAGYYITFAPGNIIVADGDNVMSTTTDTSEGLQHTESGDYLMVKYTDSTTSKFVSMVLMLTKVEGEAEAGLRDGEYLTVISDEKDGQYRFMERMAGA